MEVLTASASAGFCLGITRAYREMNERALNEACMHLLTTIGMNGLYPDGAEQFRHRPTPQIRFEMPQA